VVAFDVDDDLAPRADGDSVGRNEPLDDRPARHRLADPVQPDHLATLAAEDREDEPSGSGAIRGDP